MTSKNKCICPGCRFCQGLEGVSNGDSARKDSDLPGSTAQGGSGSFKDRKPIGEVRCCESWMAEQTH